MNGQHTDALEAAVFAGNIMLESGAEIYRVQDTIMHIARAYGVHSCNTFIMSSGIFVTSGGDGEEYFAKVRYIPLGAVRLDKVEAVNQLSREIAAGKHTVGEAMARMREIAQMPRKSRLGRTLAAGLGSGSFCFLFGGGLPESLAAFLAGVVLYSYLLMLEGKKLSKITVNISGGAIATLCAVAACALGLGSNPGQVIIGAIMPLVPGVSFTSAIRDIANADYIAGSVRLIDALLIAFCIAGGVGLAYSLVARLGGGVFL